MDVVRTCLERIELLQPQLNAFITVTAEAAMDAAKAAEKHIGQGQWKGPLHGIPVGIEDFYDTAGVPTTAAFERFRDRVPKKDAVSVAKLARPQFGSRRARVVEVSGTLRALRTPA